MDEDNDKLKQYIGKMVELVLDDKWFYHGRLLSFDERDIELDDVKDGVSVFSRNRRYAIHPMSGNDMLRLAAKMGSSSEITTNLEKLNQNIESFWAKNREDAHRMAEAASALLGFMKDKHDEKR